MSSAKLSLLNFGSQPEADQPMTGKNCEDLTKKIKSQDKKMLLHFNPAPSPPSCLQTGLSSFPLSSSKTCPEHRDLIWFRVFEIFIKSILKLFQS
jgi:hypothetical protein